MKNYKVLLYKTEGVGLAPEQAWLERNGISNIRLVRLDGSHEEFLSEAADADAVTVIYTKMTHALMLQAPRLKVITTHTIGIDQVDLAAATELGICVGNIPDYCIEDVALHTVALLLNCVRRITPLHEDVQQGGWDAFAAGKIHRIGAKTYGFVSFGNIPRRIVELLRPFGPQFAAYDPFAADEVFEQYGVSREKNLATLFSRCDFISVHTPLNKETHHMIDAAILRRAKDGMILLSLGRGGVIDEAALRDALACGKVGAAGLDVIENEAQASTVLKGLKNVIITPHAAYYSEESLVEAREKSLAQICQVLIKKEPPSFLVNRDVLRCARFLSGPQT